MNVVKLEKKAQFSKNYLSRSAACNYLDCPTWHIQKLLNSGKINAYKVPGNQRYLYLVDELDKCGNYKVRHYIKKTEKSCSHDSSDHSLEFLEMVKETLENVSETNNQLSKVTDMITTTNNQIHAIVSMLLRITKGDDEKTDGPNS